MGWDLRDVRCVGVVAHHREVCHCILERADFTEANAHDISGLTVTFRGPTGGYDGGDACLPEWSDDTKKLPFEGESRA